jgi:hypothetical protein
MEVVVVVADYMAVVPVIIIVDVVIVSVCAVCG